MSYPPDVAALVDDAESLCRRLAGEVLGGVYVVPRSAVVLPAGEEWRAGGWAGPAVAAQCRPAIEAAGRWKGFAPAVVVNDTPNVDPEHRAWAFRTTTVHELAHLVADPAAPVEIADPAAAAESLAATVRNMTAAGWGDAYPPARQIAWHSAQWVRVACHLATRANRAGFNVCLPLLWGYDWLSTPFAYLRVLSGEIAATDRRPIPDVLALPPNPALNALWLADAAAFYSASQSPPETSP